MKYKILGKYISEKEKNTQIENTQIRKIHNEVNYKFLNEKENI